jgi:hypothetical protein
MTIRIKGRPRHVEYTGQYLGFRRLSRVSIEASFGGRLVNSEIARANCMSEIARLGAVGRYRKS